MNRSEIRANKIRRVTWLLCVILAPACVVILNDLFLYANFYYKDYSVSNDQIFQLALSGGLGIGCLPHGIAHWGRTFKFIMGKIACLCGVILSFGASFAILLIPALVIVVYLFTLCLGFLLGIFFFGQIFFVIDTFILMFGKPLIYFYEHRFYRN